MGWIDDRIYCHPKVLRVSKPARWTYVAGIAYSSGWGTRGVLEASALEAIGCDKKTRADLVAAGLWDEIDGVVLIHDWEDHNGRRDDRRTRERERLRTLRERQRNAVQTQDSTQYERATDAPATRVDGSEGSDGSEELGALALLSKSIPPSLSNYVGDSGTRGTPHDRLLAIATTDEDRDKIRRASNGLVEFAIVDALEAATLPDAQDPLACALARLSLHRNGAHA